MEKTGRPGTNALKELYPLNSIDDIKTRAILVIEDELLILGIVKSVLSEFGREVLTASSIQRARDLFDSCAAQIELLITDVSLADGSGLEFASWAVKECPSLKVVLMTGLARHEDFPQGAQFQLLEKPFDIESLKQVVTRSLLPT